MANKIKLKRGAEANLPTLDVGEPAFTTDTKKPFIGSDTGNIELATEAQINALAYNVKSFGAKGDGVTDDTIAIQNAINYVSVSGGKIFFPKGNYLVSNELLIPDNTNNLTIEGMKSSIIKVADNTNKTLFYALSPVNITIKNITLNGNRANQTVGTWPHGICGAILLSRSNNAKIENCNFYDFNYGVMVSSENSKNGKVINCYFENCNSDIDCYAVGLIIDGNFSKGCTQNSIQIEPPNATVSDTIANYQDETQANLISVNNNIVNNVIIDCASIGINIFAGCENIIIANNTLTNIGITGIRAYYDNMKNIEISNNIITNVTYNKPTEDGLPQNVNGAGIAVAKCYSVNISNNIINYCRVGIFGDTSRRAKVSGNVISYCRTSGICFYGGSYNKINDNYMKDNSINQVFWANAGIYLNTETQTSTSNNLTRETTSNTNKQRACVFIHTNCTEIKCCGDIGIGTTEGAINNDAKTNSRLATIDIPSFSKLYLEDGCNNIGDYYKNGVKVLSTQQSAISDAIAGQEVAKINAILLALRTHGIIAT